MTIILSDSFAGTGTITGRTPDSGAHVWGDGATSATPYPGARSPISVVGGYAVCEDVVTYESYACYPASGTLAATVTGGFTINAVVAAAVDLTYDASALSLSVYDVTAGLSVEFYVYNRQYSAAEHISGEDAAEFEIGIYIYNHSYPGGAGTAESSVVQITDPANVDTPLSITYDGASFAMAFGSGTVTLMAPVQLTKCDVVDMMLASNVKVGGIDLADVAGAVTSSADVACPHPIVASYAGAVMNLVAPTPSATAIASTVVVSTPWAITLADSFTGSGSLNGRLPDSGDFTWKSDGTEGATYIFNSYPVSISDGYAKCSDISLPYNSGFAYYPASRDLGMSAGSGFVLDFVLSIAQNPYNSESFLVQVIDSSTSWRVKVSVENRYDDPDLGPDGPLTTRLVIAAYNEVGNIAFDQIDISNPTGVDLPLSWAFTGATHTVVFGGGSVSISPATQIAEVDVVEMAMSTTTGVSSVVFSPPVIPGIYAVAPSPIVEFYVTGPALNVTAVTAPSPLVTIQAHDSTGENAAHITAPRPALSFYTGAVVKAKAPSPTVSATGTTTNWVKAAITSPKPTVSATATVSGMASISARAPSPNLIGYGGAVCSVTLTGRPTVHATGTTGAVASIAVTCPLFQVTASATAQSYGSLHVIAPSPRMGTTMQAWVVAPMARLTAIGSATITATYEAYAINLNHVPVRGIDPVDEVTRYTNFPFTHVVRYKNSYYGANSTGLYLLEGTTDDEAPIEFAVKTAMTDFDSPLKKTVVSAYFAGRLGSQATIDLHVGEDGAKTYSHTTVRGEHAQNYRQKFGRGTDARYYAIGASGAGTIEIDSIELMVQSSKRRI